MQVTLPRFLDSFRVRYLVVMSVFFLLSNLVLRGVLLLAFSGDLPVGGNTPFSFLPGALNDLATLVFVLLLPALFILMAPERFLRHKVGRATSLLVFFIFCGIFTFNSFAEYFFWEEFHSRFNFIAVDYLIYTKELVENVVESYPLPWLLAGVALISIACTALCWRIIRRASGNKVTGRAVSAPSLKTRLAGFGGLVSAAVLVFIFFSPVAASSDRAWNEFAKNGVYELFSAFRHNQLDYRAFYKTMDKDQAFSIMRSSIKDADPIFRPAQGDSLVRMVKGVNSAREPNVVVVIMESMGSKWLGEYSPNLTALADQGLSFTNMLSTGTRTVRGIEAVMLSVPPTPGNSIVRRPDNDGLFSLGTVFKEQGYDLSFIYGGFGYFDNMNDFFEGNGYRIVDKLDFAEKNKTFSTAWGQCDEDLFAESLDRADASFARGVRFQQVLLTTSNHRPFTYPDGKVSLPSGDSRRGAIQYSDYAIGKFIEEAKKKPWFENTVFIFVGDHPSSVAGKREVPADEYGIVCIFYGPKYFQPEKATALCSQIDVAPTLFARLGWEYRSQFFGTNACGLTANDGRAWISTYQLLGYRTNDHLVVLKPNSKITIENLLTGEMTGAVPAGDAAVGKIVDMTIASYQCASDLFTEKKLTEEAVAAYVPKILSSQESPSLSGAKGSSVR